MPPPGATALLAIDWGTTSVRAYRLGGDGEVLDIRESPLGIQRVRDGAFPAALRSLLGDWIDVAAPRVACGMIGSRQGWVEVPYVDCPAGQDVLARSIVRTPDGALAIVAGVRCRDTDGIPDVMRGEETQIVGAFADDAGAAIAVLPGTHSKWAVVRARRIEGFATFMTGELYAVLKDHSILARMMSAEHAVPGDADFRRGVTAALHPGASAGTLLHRLFGARTLALAGELDPGSVADYLSGLLIGSEISAGLEWSRQQGAAADRVTLIGACALCRRYAVALADAGIDVDAGPPAAAARGLWAIATQSGLMR
jgi:2-dehydro-3-deoxygalactonokinase